MTQIYSEGGIEMNMPTLHHNPEIVSDIIDDVVTNPTCDSLAVNVREHMKASIHDEVLKAAEVPTEAEREAEEREKCFNEHLITFDVEYPHEECLLEVDGVPFFARGDIHAIKAKQKQGKTNAIAIMVAAILCGQWGRLRAAMRNARIMVIDTEQKGADAQQIYARVFDLAGLPHKDIHDRFRYFGLRALDQEQKLKFTREAILRFQPDIVYIDGVVDLMGNFNEVEDSKLIIEELMQLSTAKMVGKEVAVVCVLHVNKAEDDHNMRGHAGTMLSQKAGTVLEVTKRNGIMTVSCTDARHQEAPAWSFRFNEEGQIVDADAELRQAAQQHEEEKQQAAQKRIADKRDERYSIIRQILESEGGKTSRSYLKMEMIKRLMLSGQRVDTIIREAIQDEVICQGKGKQIALKSAPTR